MADKKVIPTAMKLAIFFTSIPSEKAVSIMKHFSIGTMEKIASEIRSLGVIDLGTQEDVFREVSDRLVSGVAPSGGEDVAIRILNGVIGEDEARKLLERAKPKRPVPFAKIVTVGAQDLATILSNEQPATAAIILGFFPAKKTAEVLSFLDEEIRSAIVLRLAKNLEADYEIVTRIEKIFVQKVISSSRNSTEEEKTVLGGPNFIAELFQNVDRELEQGLIEAIQDESEELANQIRDLMFTFDDIVNLTDQDIQKLLREVPTDKLTLALRGVSKELFEKFAGNLSKRARENLEEEMDLMGKVKRSDIEAEQKAIVGIIRALESAGEITISTGDDADEYL